MLLLLKKSFSANTVIITPEMIKKDETTSIGIDFSNAKPPFNNSNKPEIKSNTCDKRSCFIF